MKIISVVGKVDTRILVYPMARALALNGLTAVITDDGAYRRLYNGNEDIGTVSGVDIGVASKIDENTVDMLEKTGLKYDNLIIVSSKYLHPNASGIIVCHGIDRSMMDTSSDTVYDDGIIVPELVSNTEEDTTIDDNKSKKKKKGKAEENTHIDTEEKPVEQESDESVENEITKIEEVEESYRDKLIRLQNENQDKIVIPEYSKFVEVQISYNAPPKKSTILGITLNEGLIRYVYDCEETKTLGILLDKGMPKLYATIISKVTDIQANEALTLLSKLEGAGSTEKKKKK